jgi:hypothetical protein
MKNLIITLFLVFTFNSHANDPFAGIECEINTTPTGKVAPGMVWSPAFKIRYSGCGKQLCMMDSITCTLNGEKIAGNGALCTANDDGTCPDAKECLIAKSEITFAKVATIKKADNTEVEMPEVKGAAQK